MYGFKLQTQTEALQNLSHKDNDPSKDSCRCLGDIGTDRYLGTVLGHVLAVEQIIPNEVFVATQILQFHCLDLVVIKVKLLEIVWKIW